ncbi:nucleotidyltransferase family protein [Taibaiella chishuiensis]|uniref:CBS domain protein n=1 Tax=Taibaiella chishuiensis TaxID=1434707 RepID=A0A2P8DB94_9BACT|nr:nucleotidyltransferase family protein [Taibaiella chishuiensis]PSK94447.1 CBS domain protein [Taibaiella chishuiensis]
MFNYRDHIISSALTIKDALSIIDQQGLIANVLFVVDGDGKLVGSISDGDIRRGLLKDIGINDAVSQVMRTEFKFLYKDNITPAALAAFRENGIFFVPVVDATQHVTDILNLHTYRIALPVDAIMMAGGKGQRLLPLTKDTPKPLLPVGDKPIIEHNIDRLAMHGISNIYLSVNYLADQLVRYFGDGAAKQLNIGYIRENEPLGTIGSVKMVETYEHDTLLVMNSDLLTNIDFHEFYTEFKNQDADMAIAATSYHVDIPYAVLEADGDNVIHSLKEKPRYTYYSNAGIYLMKKSVIDHIPDAQFYNVTDLIEALVGMKKKVVSFPILGYWLDIGKHEDYRKAQEDIKHLKL